jgi:hypothetical protein
MINLSEDVKNFLSKHIPEYDKFVETDDLESLQCALDDFIVYNLDENYKSTPLSRQVRR